MILDRLGIRRTGFMFVFFMVLGAMLTAYWACNFYRAGGPCFGMMSSLFAWDSWLS